MKPTGALALLVLLAAPALAADGKYSRDVKLSKGKAKVEFTPGIPEGTPTGPARHPRVGVAPSPTASFGNTLARQLDDGGKVGVASPSQLGGNTAAAPPSFEQQLRSELAVSVSGMCKTARLDYVLLMGAPQSSMKTDVSAYVFGLGRTRMRNTQVSRLVDCRSGKSVWTQTVLFETSQGVFGTAFGGTAAFFGSPESEAAMAKIYAEKLIADMGW